MRSVAEWMDEAEQAWDAYRTASQQYACAKADYEKAFWTARATCGEKSEWARREHAEHQTHKERTSLLWAEETRNVQRKYVDVCLGELVAAQSDRKFMGKLDGGTDWGDFGG